MRTVEGIDVSPEVGASKGNFTPIATDMYTREQRRLEHHLEAISLSNSIDEENMCEGFRR